MEKYFKYDLKSNRKFFVSTLLVFMIFLFSIVSINFFGSLTSKFDIDIAIYSLEVLIPLILMLVMIYFIISSYYNDLFTKRGILTFSLPISYKSILFSKTLVINLFFIVLLAFVWILFFLLGRNLLKENLDIILFIFAMVNVTSGLILMEMQTERFGKKRGSAIFSSLISFIIIFAISLILEKFIGIYRLVGGISTIYYLLAAFVLFEVNIKIINKKFDLS